MKKSRGAKTLLYPTPLLVVGSYDAEGRANVMTAAWGGIECAVVQVHELGLHTQFIGEVKDVKVDEGCLGAEEHSDVRKLDPIACALGDAAAGYYALGELVGPAFSMGKALMADAGS